MNASDDAIKSELPDIMKAASNLIKKANQHRISFTSGSNYYAMKFEELQLQSALAMGRLEKHFSGLKIGLVDSTLIEIKNDLQKFFNKDTISSERVGAGKK